MELWVAVVRPRVVEGMGGRNAAVVPACSFYRVQLRRQAFYLSVLDRLPDLMGDGEPMAAAATAVILTMLRELSALCIEDPSFRGKLSAAAFVPCPVPPGASIGGGVPEGTCVWCLYPCLAPCLSTCLAPCLWACLAPCLRACLASCLWACLAPCLRACAGVPRGGICAARMTVCGPCLHTACVSCVSCVSWFHTACVLCVPCFHTACVFVYPSPSPPVPPGMRRPFMFSHAYACLGLCVCPGSGDAIRRLRPSEVYDPLSPQLLSLLDPHCFPVEGPFRAPDIVTALRSLGMQSTMSR